MEFRIAVAESFCGRFAGIPAISACSRNTDNAEGEARLVIASRPSAEAFHLAQPDDVGAVGRTDFPGDVIDVVLDRLLRQVKLNSDLLVGEMPSQQFHELLLSSRKPQFRAPGKNRIGRSEEHT